MKIATTGSGFIVDSFLEGLVQVDNLECVAMYTRKKSTLDTLSSKYNISTIYEDYDEMLNDPNIDAIYVASCNSLHYAQTKKALLANKHVLCEKPFTPTVKEFEELVMIAKERKLLLMEAITVLHMPNFNQIKANLAKLGDIKIVQCNFSQYSSRYPAFLRGELPNVFNPAFAGGALGDLNIYNLHFVIGLFGEPSAIKYFPNLHSNGIDTSGILILSYPTFQCVCIGAKDSESNSSTQIQGIDGYIELCTKTSLLDNLQLVIKEEKSDIALPQDKPRLYYELVDFLAMFNKMDFALANTLLEHSRMVIKAYEKARIEANIIFTNN